MKKLEIFICNFIICIVFAGLATGVNAQSVDSENFYGDSQVEAENHLTGSADAFPLDMRTLPEGAYHPGQLRIQFARDFEGTLENIVFKVTDDNLVKTGISVLDELNEIYGVYEYKSMLEGLYKISEASLQYKERHREWGFHLWYELRLDDDVDIIEAFIEFEELDEVKLAEPVLKKEVDKPVESRPAEQDCPERGWSPNDPMYNQQWHFNNTGQMGGVPGMDCNAELAWEIETGNPDVIVAIMDSGMEFTHPDLAGNMWENIGPQGTGTAPGSHGTHVGGTVGAVSNNNEGVAGLAGGSGADDGVRCMTIDRNAYGFLPGCIYAADNGAAINQNSWGFTQGGYFPAWAKDGIDYFNEHGGGDALDGGLTVFSAGNSNANFARYPAYYVGTFAVASHDRLGMKSGFSNYGPWIDIIAPGTDVLSTETGHNYSWKSGTSMSAPHVSGGAALVVSYAYGELTRDELQEIMENGANPDIYQYNSPYFEGMLGSGRLDVYASLNLLDLPFTVIFEITDEEENEITDATVTFDGIENPKGDYVFEEITSGTYEYKVERAGYVTVEEEITVEEETTIEVVMELAMFTATFEVEDEEGNAITDAVIQLNDVEYEPGEYVIGDLIYGEYLYSVAKEGYKTMIGETEIIDEDITVNVVLEEGETDTYPVVFKVEDVEGNAIGGAVITFNEKDYTTDANGNAYIPNVETGIYPYSVSKEGFFTFEDLLAVDNNVYKEITLLFEAYAVTFDITDEEGDPVTDAVVTLNYVEYEPGEYVIEDIVVGEHPYSVAKDGYITKFGVVEVVDEDVMKEITLTEGTDDLCTVTFIVEDADGVAVEDAVVTFDENDYTTDGDGQVVIDDVEVGFYSYLVNKDGYIPVEDMVTVDQDVTVNVTIYEETFTVTFNVVDQEGEPITDAVVTLNGMTNEPGDYVFEDIVAGTYDYIVEREGYETGEGEVTVEEDTTVEVTMTAELYTLALVANPEEGGDVEGADEYKMDAEVAVEAIPADHWLFIDWTDEDGEVVSEEAEFTYTMPGEDVTLTANFEPQLFTLTLNADPAEGGDVDGDGEYAVGEEVTITATPVEEFDFIDWTGDTQHIDNVESATATVTMPAEDITLTANFQHISVEEIHAAEINVYPNPARDEFKVESSEMIKQIRLISISGQVIMNVDVGTLNHKLNVSNLRPGVYFMEIHTAEDIVTKRVQISH